MDFRAIENEIIRIVGDCRPLGVPASNLDDVLALANAGEPGVAVENLCEQLFEYNVVVPTAVLNRIVEVGVAMGLQDSYWSQLASN